MAPADQTRCPTQHGRFRLRTTQRTSPDADVADRPRNCTTLVVDAAESTGSQLSWMRVARAGPGWHGHLSLAGDVNCLWRDERAAKRSDGRKAVAVDEGARRRDGVGQAGLAG